MRIKVSQIVQLAGPKTQGLGVLKLRRAWTMQGLPTGELPSQIVAVILTMYYLID